MPHLELLFLCTDDSCRSRMAEAFLGRHGGDRFRAFSVGIEPSEVHQPAMRVMAGVNVPLDGHRSKGAREQLGKLSSIHLIVVCARAERECPKLFPGALRRHSWPFPDPAAAGSPEQLLRVFRDVRDRSERRVVAWLEDPETNKAGVRS